MHNALLYAATASIWGTTWIAIKFQIGVIDPTLSVSYRFALAAAILFAICVAQNKASTLRMGARDHLFVLGLGAFTFCLNYITIYWGSAYITSGLVALCFSTLPVFNALNQRMFFKIPLDRRVIYGSILGLAGIATVFAPDILHSHNNPTHIYTGIGLCLLATYIASMGNMFSVRNTRHGLPVLATSAYGMTYGAIIAFVAALLIGVDIRFDTEAPYVLSWLYLSVFGSAAAFLCYLTLLRNIGADRAGYSAILFPIIALSISTIFEGYSWSVSGLIGVAMILGGNVITMRRKGAIHSKQSRA